MRSNNLFLIDSSVWIEVLSRSGAHHGLRERVKELLGAGLVATAGIVRLEILVDANDEADLVRLRAHLENLHWLPVEESDWSSAARLGYDLQRHGTTVPNADLLIAQMALAADATMVHLDHHFDVIVSHVPLRCESYVAP